MNIRRFQKEDASQVKELHFETVNTVNAKDYTDEQRKAWSPPEGTAEKWRNSLEQRSAFVAEEEGKILGFGDTTNEGELKRLYVHKDHQGAGIGSALLEKLEEEAQKRGLRELYLFSTITAHTFYQRHGYEDIEKTTKKMGDVNLDVFKMRKNLSSK